MGWPTMWSKPSQPVLWQHTSNEAEVHPRQISSSSCTPYAQDSRGVTGRLSATCLTMIKGVSDKKQCI
eukprot:4131712-Amphidinium_carterae.1